MQFQLSDEQQAIQAEARVFADNEVDLPPLFGPVIMRIRLPS
jgi:hypothetical protein